MRVQYNPEIDTWRPLSVTDVRPLVLDGPAWLSGGVALDVWLGYQSRQHGDIDVSILRAQWSDFAARLPTWLRPYAAQDGFLSPIHEECAWAPVDNIWCFDDRTGSWGLQVNLEDGDGEQWMYRRCREVTAPWSQVILNVEGLQIMAPEVQLLWKSKDPTPKDAADRAAVAPRLDPTAHQWLTNAISIAHPASPWNDRRSR